MNPKNGRPGSEHLRKSKCRLLLVFVERDGGGLQCATGVDDYGLERDFSGVQGDGVSRLGNVHIDLFDAREGCGFEVGPESELVMRGHHVGRQPLCIGAGSRDKRTQRESGGTCKSRAHRNYARQERVTIIVHENPYWNSARPPRRAWERNITRVQPSVRRLPSRVSVPIYSIVTY